MRPDRKPNTQCICGRWFHCRSERKHKDLCGVCVAAERRVKKEESAKRRETAKELTQRLKKAKRKEAVTDRKTRPAQQERIDMAEVIREEQIQNNNLSVVLRDLIEFVRDRYGTSDSKEAVRDALRGLLTYGPAWTRDEFSIDAAAMGISNPDDQIGPIFYGGD